MHYLQVCSSPVRAWFRALIAWYSPRSISPKPENGSQGENKTTSHSSGICSFLLPVRSDIRRQDVGKKWGYTTNEDTADAKNSAKISRALDIINSNLGVYFKGWQHFNTLYRFLSIVFKAPFFYFTLLGENCGWNHSSCRDYFWTGLRLSYGLIFQPHKTSIVRYSGPPLFPPSIVFIDYFLRWRSMRWGMPT